MWNYDHEPHREVRDLSRAVRLDCKRPAKEQKPAPREDGTGCRDAQPGTPQFWTIRILPENIFWSIREITEVLVRIIPISSMILSIVRSVRSILIVVPARWTPRDEKQSRNQNHTGNNGLRPHVNQQMDGSVSRRTSVMVMDMANGTWNTL